MSHEPLGYLPHVNAQDAMDYMDGQAAWRIMNGKAPDAFAAVFKSLRPLTADETETYLRLTPDDLEEQEELDKHIHGFEVTVFPYPVAGVAVREYLADFMEWCRTYHNDDPSTVAYLTCTYSTDKAILKVFDRAGIHNKILTRSNGKWFESAWDDMALRGSKLTFISNPFTCTPEDIKLTRGQDT